MSGASPVAESQMTNGRRAAVVVLGDLGRSPRMQYHALALANDGFSVDLIGYGGRPADAEVAAHQRIRIHELPMYAMNDYWRFTPHGLQRLLHQAGLSVDAVDAWGNRRCIAGNLDRWPSYRRWHSLRNEVDIPVQVWAFAHNPT